MSLQSSPVRTTATRHPALLTFAALWLASAAIIAARGEFTALAFQVAFLVIALVLATITARFTPRATVPTLAAERGRGVAVTAVILLALGATVLMVMAFHGIIPIGWQPAPITLMWLNPILMVIVPGIPLLALGLRPANLGLSRGHRPWLIGLLWSAPFLLMVGVSLVMTGQPGPFLLLRRAVSSLLQNGFSEEFLWRGVLQTALERRLGGEWGLVLASLLFGLWHLPGNLAGFGGDFLAAFAFSILSQGLMGLAFGFIYQRTGNLLAPTLFHIATHLP